MNAAVPSDPAGLTAGWLAGHLGRAVEMTRATRIGLGRSFSGGAQYRLDLSDGTSAVAKFAPTDARLRAAMAGSNQREAHFYRTLRRDLPAPELICAVDDPSSGAVCLLIEDLSANPTACYQTGLDLDDATAAVTALAQVHARWWGRGDAAGLPNEADALRNFADNWQKYPARFADIFGHSHMPGALSRIANQIAAGAGPARTAPHTLLHGDPQVDNLVFDAGGACRLLDWQFVQTGPGIWDVAYLLISSLPPKLRRRQERRLVAQYAQALTAHGAPAVDPELLWQQYRQAGLPKLAMTVMASVTMPANTPVKRAWRQTDLDRLTAFLSDHAAGAPALCA